MTGMLSYLILLLAASDFHDPLLPLWAMEWLARGFLYAWLFCMGATVGSFLNVVVYRLPRGKNLAYPGSFCPRCGHAIRLNDNVPILSWLALRGRCRDCGGRISPRYFFVELATASMFLIVLAGEYFLPEGVLGSPTRRPLTPYDVVPFWCMYATHVGLVTTLITATLIFSDGQRVSPLVFLPICLVGIVLPLIWPDIRSVAAFVYRDDHAWWTGLIDGLAGATTGLVLAGLGSWRWRRLRGAWPAIAPLAWSCAVGVVLGWQRTLYVLPASIVVCLTIAHMLRALRSKEQPDAVEELPGGEEPVNVTGEPVDPSTPKGSGVFGGGASAQIDGSFPPKTPDPVPTQADRCPNSGETPAPGERS
jgi:leader peptidase (prepilin peptidase)/N-methyltransferase